MKLDRYIKRIQKELDAITEKRSARETELSALEEKRGVAQADEKAARENQHGAMVVGDDALFHRLRDDEREASDRVELCSRRIAMLNEPLFTADEANALIDEMHAVTENAIEDAEREAAALLKKIVAIGAELNAVVDNYNDVAGSIAANSTGIVNSGFNRNIYGMFDLLNNIEQVQKRKPASALFK